MTSDANAVLAHTRDVVHLEDGELCALDSRGFTISTMDRAVTSRAPITLDHDDETLSGEATPTSC